jgi:hypothetical protein
MVMNGAQRVGRVPDVPTTLEAGYKDADFPIWIGILAPAKTPHDVSSTEFDTRIRKRSVAKTAGIKPNRKTVPLNCLLAFRVREVWPPRSGLFRSAARQFGR